jgi:hypothetical protein
MRGSGVWFLFKQHYCMHEYKIGALDNPLSGNPMQVYISTRCSSKWWLSAIKTRLSLLVHWISITNRYALYVP